jgi:hypothetical protein
MFFSQSEINAAVDNAVNGRFHSDWNVSGGWNYSSDRVVFSKGSDYLCLTTDGWRDADRQKVVIKNMRGRAILSML